MNKKGMSPVIATVILLAVTIVVSIIVSMWMASTSAAYLVTERVDTLQVIPTLIPGDPLATPPISGGWDVSVVIRNTGSKDVIIRDTFFNGELITLSTDCVVASKVGSDLPIDGLVLSSGAKGTINVFISKTYKTIVSSVTCEIRLHSSAGFDYIQNARLP